MFGRSLPLLDVSTLRQQVAIFAATMLRHKLALLAWFLTFGVIAVLGPTMRLSTAAVLLTLGTIAVFIVCAQWRLPATTVSRMLHDVDEVGRK